MDLSQHIRAAVTGKNRRCLESIYAGSGLVLASLLRVLLLELSVDYLLVFVLVKLSFLLFGSEFVFDASLD
jgi:hypothetical protein